MLPCGVTAICSGILSQVAFLSLLVTYCWHFQLNKHVTYSSQLSQALSLSTMLLQPLHSPEAAGVGVATFYRCFLKYPKALRKDSLALPVFSSILQWITLHALRWTDPFSHYHLNMLPQKTSQQYCPYVIFFSLNWPWGIKPRDLAVVESTICAAIFSHQAFIITEILE